MVGSKKTAKSSLSLVEKFYLGILLVIFGGIVLHAPLSVGLGTLWPDYSLLIKSWKEILMLISAILAGIILIHRHKIAILKEPLMIGIAVYAVIHLLSLVFFARGQTSSSVMAGLMIDLRYVLYFVLVYIALQLYPTYRKVFIKVGIAGALIVMVFALLQVFVLPADVLKYIGYGNNNILPYLTVDQNTDFIRINSTLRGPNSVGAYAVMVLTGVAAWLATKRNSSNKKLSLVLATLLFGGIISLWASYSRSALIAVAISVAIVLYLTIIRRISKRGWIIGATVILALAGCLFISRGSTFVANVILHDNPSTGSLVTSNDGHIESLRDGVIRLSEQPFGAGVGSTGSASLYSDSPLIIENQYLFIAHEVGWLGLAMFSMILIGVFTRLWQRRADWLGLAVFASGIGLVVINIFLPIWVDDTISIVWWGLAGIVVGGKWYMVDGRSQKAQEDY